MSKLSYFFILIVIIASAIFGVSKKEKIDDFINAKLDLSFRLLPIELIHVEAPFRYVSEDKIRQYLIKAGVLEASFFNINMSKIIKTLKQDHWLKDISVSREWPNKIRVSFNENKPLAYLNDDSVILKEQCNVVGLTGDIKKILQNSNSQTLNQQDSLPLLVGDKKNFKKLCDTLENIEIYVKPINNRIKKLVLSKRDSVYITLDNGLTVLLGNNNVLERVKRFVGFVSKKGYGNLLAGKDANLEQSYVDMRYHSGLAVGYNKGINLTELMETA